MNKQLVELALAMLGMIACTVLAIVFQYQSLEYIIQKDMFSSKFCDIITYVYITTAYMSLLWFVLTAIKIEKAR
jgi:hypothetical protein